MAEPSDKEILLQFFNRLREEVIANQKAKGIYASGASAEGLQAETDDIQIGTVGQLIDTEGYFQQQEFGRGPSKKSGSGQSLQERIYDWLEFKKYGINYTTVTTGEAARGVTAEQKRTSLSWAISTKIHNEGTLTYRLGKQTGVLSDVLTQDKVNTLTSIFAKKYAAQVSSDVLNSFNK